MGEVFKVRDSKLDRFVVLKILPEHLTDNPEALARFEREAKAVASLNHPDGSGALRLVAGATTILPEVSPRR